MSYEDSKSRDYAEIENIEKAGPIGIADYYFTNNSTPEEFKQKLIDFIEKY
jgi:dephospho-CoA kinase